MATNGKVDISDLSDERPTYEMTWEDWLRLCDGDELTARQFVDFRSDVVQDPPNEKSKKPHE